MDSQGIGAEGSNPGPSGQPSCLADVETKTQKAEGSCFGEGLQAGLEPHLLSPWSKGAVWECWGALSLAQAFRWTAEEWAQRILGSLLGKGGVWGPMDLCIWNQCHTRLERHQKGLCI